MSQPCMAGGIFFFHDVLEGSVFVQLAGFVYICIYIHTHTRILNGADLFSIITLIERMQVFI